MISMSLDVSIMPAVTMHGPLGLQLHALGRVAVHPQAQRLQVQDDVGHVLAHAGDRRELVQHALDLDRGDRGALERGEEHPAQRVAERDAEPALQRLHDDHGLAVGPAAGLDVQPLRLDQVLPVLLNHERYLAEYLSVEKATGPRAMPTPGVPSRKTRGRSRPAAAA
jgi:hypothetical protein